MSQSSQLTTSLLHHRIIHAPPPPPAVPASRPNLELHATHLPCRKPFTNHQYSSFSLTFFFNLFSSLFGGTRNTMSTPAGNVVASAAAPDQNPAAQPEQAAVPPTQQQPAATPPGPAKPQPPAHDLPDAKFVEPGKDVRSPAPDGGPKTGEKKDESKIEGKSVREIPRPSPPPGGFPFFPFLPFTSRVW